MTALSVNLNKVALLRNSRPIGVPSVIELAKQALDAGASGITIHPRPDERHIRAHDVAELAELLRDERYRDRELNLEGNPFEGAYLEHARLARPDQCTLVPDAPGQATSDHGWKLAQNLDHLREVVAELKGLGSRVSLFMDGEADAMRGIAETRADRVELYTEPYARAFETGGGLLEETFGRFSAAARAVHEQGLGLNAGHDLNLQNLPRFLRIPGILEVSIGHALISDALRMGMTAAVKAYLSLLAEKTGTDRAAL